MAAQASSSCFLLGFPFRRSGLCHAADKKGGHRGRSVKAFCLFLSGDWSAVPDGYVAPDGSQLRLPTLDRGVPVVVHHVSICACRSACEYDVPCHSRRRPGGEVFGYPATFQVAGHIAGKIRFAIGRETHGGRSNSHPWHRPEPRRPPGTWCRGLRMRYRASLGMTWSTTRRHRKSRAHASEAGLMQAPA